MTTGSRAGSSSSEAPRASRSSPCRDCWRRAGGSGGGGGEDALKDVLKFSNWPLYIDVDEKTKKHPTIDAFTKKTGIKVDYFEDINDNATFFAKIQGPLSQGRASTATSS